MHSLPKLPHDYKREDFQRFVGEELIFHAVPEPVKVRLDNITSRPSPSFLTREGFSLNFSTDKSTRLIGGIYEIRASAREAYSVYVEPIVSVGSRQLYQAVFF